MLGQVCPLSPASTQPLGDPTVRRFESRDVDAWILPRERAAVKQWEESPGWVHGVSRADNDYSAKLYNHGEGPY